MRTGLVSVSFRQLSPEAIIDLTVRCGLESIEWGGDVHVPCGDLENARHVGEMTRAKGLAVACYGSYCHLTEEESLEDVVRTAEALGAPLIRAWAGTKGSRDCGEEEREVIVRRAQQLGELAGKAGMEVAFEYHGGTLTDDARSALKLLTDVGRSNVGCLWQPPVGMSTDDCVKGMRTVAPFIRNIHVFSWKQVNDGIQRLPLVEGAEKWHDCLKEIALLPGERTLLLEFVREDDPEQLVQDAECLRNWLK